MNIDDVRQVLIIGAGTMGQQIGLQCASHGYDVVLYDIAPESLAEATAHIKEFAAFLVSQERLSEAEAGTAVGRIRTTTDAAEAGREADLVSESVPEDPELKKKVFSQFNALCPARTIFTTNTSYLVPSMVAEATGRPDRFAAFHFHQYVWESNVADIMPHPGTAPETVELLAAFARRIGQIPIVLQKESNGYVFNAMLSAVNGAALTLAAKGVASVEDIDRAWMAVMKTRVGPFGILDVIGLKTAYDITQYWAEATNDPQLRTNAEFLKNYLDRDRQGVKNGQGFYSYPDPAYGRPDFLATEPSP